MPLLLHSCRCRAWPSALALAAQLLRRPELVAGRRVADLGAGLGVAGMAAALAGASEVVLLDREPLALQCALLSAAASGVSSVVGLGGIRLAAFVQDAPLSAAADGMPQQQQHQQVSREHGVPAAAAAAAASPAPPAELLRLAQLYAAHRSAQQHPPQHTYEGGGTAAGCGGAAGAAIAEELLALLAVQAPQGQQPAPGDNSSTHSRQQHTPLHVHTKQQPGCVLYAAQQFDWSTAAGLHQAGQFDVVLAADVLYESEAVEPVAAAVRQLLPRAGGSLLLADPPARTAAHRERFVRLLAAGGSGGARGRVQFGLTECSVEDCDVALLDPEMRGGVSTSSVSVQLMLLTAHDGGDTVGVKL